jgi:hypothetical protein
METKIYVVKTNIRLTCEKMALVLVQKELSLEYGGLTIIPNCSGLWVNDKNEFETDNVEIWEVVSNHLNLTFITKIALQLKRICTQKTQMFTVNGKPYYL